MDFAQRVLSNAKLTWVSFAIFRSLPSIGASSKAKIPESSNRAAERIALTAPKPPTTRVVLPRKQTPPEKAAFTGVLL